MIEFPTPSDTFRFAMDPASAGQFQVIAMGPGVALFEANVVDEPADPHAVTPDPVVFWARCVTAGFFVAADPELPVSCAVQEAQFNEAKMRQTWTIAAQNLHPGAIKLLAHVLIARGVTHLAFLQLPEAIAAPVIPADLPYPPLPKGLRFGVDYKRPQKLGQDRSVEIAFTAPPDDTVLAGTYEMLTLWGQLALLGAYPRRGQSARAAGLVPEVAGLVEPTLVVQPIDIAFACDEAAFAPIITYFHSGAGRAAPLQHIKIR
ncbi:hypothetical protein AB3Y40_01005 [Yoonia sp. R2331]|uniref:hypothetical protein n=1 Tax=Yoonia sp. R2331 TaxID=3237238 RepID=UPI0034E43502